MQREIDLHNGASEPCRPSPVESEGIQGVNLIRQILNLMGLLKDLGQVYSYEESVKYQLQLQKMAALQFLYLFGKYFGWKNTPSCFIKWGDEVEGHRIRKTQEGSYRLVESPLPAEKLPFPLMVEYGKWMFEMIPSAPYYTHCNLYEIVTSFRSRYAQLTTLEGTYLTIPSVPFLGTTAKLEMAEGSFKNDITKSLFFSDAHISDHQRFRSLTRNIRERRGRKVQILVPIYNDVKTELNSVTAEEPVPGHIYMDAMGFGMGSSCLQCTFSTKNIDHARYLHDQLHVFSPLFLALTAGTPIFKGKLSAWDVRWNIIQDSVDDRTPQEMDPKSPNYQPKSRYSSMSQYIWNNPINKPAYSDEYVRINQDVVDFLKKEALLRELPLDDKLINHIGMLTSRDFVVMHQKFLELTQDNYLLFEMINSTNWNSVRFKAPLDDDMGWRVEFRTMEIQLTPDQNAAFSLIIFILVKLFNEIPFLNFYIPISKVDQNFERAHSENAILKQKFYFRVNIYDAGEPIIRQLTLKQIFLGSKQHEFEGMFKQFVKMMKDPNASCPSKQEHLEECLDVIVSLEKFIKSLVEGDRLTLAQWMRRFVKNHKDYKQDSTVPETTMTDLLDTLAGITKGEVKDNNFGEIFHY